MQNHTVSTSPGVRDVVGAWLVCLAIAIGCFGFVAPARPERGVAALINPDLIATVAAAQNHRPGRC